jgi:hypothetical protein
MAQIEKADEVDQEAADKANMVNRIVRDCHDAGCRRLLLTQRPNWSWFS